MGYYVKFYKGDHCPEVLSLPEAINEEEKIVPYFIGMSGSEDLYWCGLPIGGVKFFTTEDKDSGEDNYVISTFAPVKVQREVYMFKEVDGKAVPFGSEKTAYFALLKLLRLAEDMLDVENKIVEDLGGLVDALKELVSEHSK